MLSENVRRFLDREEGQFFDRKSARIHPRELARHLIAFANADGGSIVLGIEDDLRMTGLHRSAGSGNALIQAGIDFCAPPVRVEHDRVACTNADGEADELLVLTVQQSERVHVRTDDKVFLRVGDQSRELNFQERLELLHDKGETHFEAVVAPDASMDDLDLDLLEEYRATIGIRGTAEDALIARGIIRRSGERPLLRNAALLLFGRQPTQWLPRADIRLLRYEGTVAETGPRMNVVKDVTLDGPLPRLLPAAFMALSAQVRGLTRLSPGGVFRTTPEYPEYAWQEALTNAVAHRSYSLSGTRIEVRIFDDRLEVESPGKLPGIVRVQNIRDVHFSRNPRITRVLSDLGFVRDVGEGVDRIYEEMAGASLPPPEFRERDYSVVVTLRKWPAAHPSDADLLPPAEPAKRLVDIPASVARALNARQLEVLRFLRTHDRVTTADVTRMFPSILERTASNDLAGLVALKLLQRVGRTRGTYYHAGGVMYRLPNEA